MKLATTLAIAMAGTATMGIAQTERDLDSHEHGAALLNIALDDGAVFLELETPWNNLVGFEHEPSTDEQKAQVEAAMAQLRQPDQLFSFNGGSCAWTKVTVESTMEHDEHHDDDHHDDKHADGDHDDHHDDEHAHDEHHDDHHDDKHADDEHHDDHHDDKHAHDEHHDDHHDDKHAHDEHHDDHHDDKHADGEHHDDHDDDKHADHDHDHDHDEGTHSSALVSYEYNCEDSGELQSIAINLFDVWSGFEELDVQLIGPGGQSAVELTAGQATVGLSDVQ